MWPSCAGPDDLPTVAPSRYRGHRPSDLRAQEDQLSPRSAPITAAPRSRDFVQSLERGLAILQSFDAHDEALSISELAGRSGLGRAAARRFVLTLQMLGYVSAEKDRYRLTPQVLELGHAYLASDGIADLALPHVERLVQRVGETSEVSVLDGPDIVYIARVTGPSIMTVSINVGARRPAFATSMGRAMLATLDETALTAFLERYPREQIQPHTITDEAALRRELDTVRHRGFALVDQELEEGLIAISAPVRGVDGRPIAAVNISTHIGRRSLAEMESLAPALREAAAQIESDLSRS